MKDMKTKIRIEYRGSRRIGFFTYEEDKGVVAYILNSRNSLLRVVLNPSSDGFDCNKLPYGSELMRIGEDAVIEEELTDINKSPFREYRECLKFENQIDKRLTN